VIPADGKVDAQPLFVPALAIGAGTHNVLYVATEHDTAYAFDADTGAVLWQVSLLGSGETTSDDRGCFQVVPEIGITATPAIDLQAGPNGTIYAVAMSKDASGNYHHRLHALDLTTGAEEFGGPAEIQATVPGAGVEGSGSILRFDPKVHKERAALLIANGIVYTSWSSHCDNGNYTAWVIGYDEATLRQASIIDLTANGNSGGMWAGGAGPAADAGGNLFVTLGNGTFDTTFDPNGFPAKGDYGNAFVRLSPAGGNLTVTDYFTMANTVAESTADTDLGSGGLMLLPSLDDSQGNPRALAAGSGKDGTIYVVDRNNLGQFNPQRTPAYQEIAASPVFSSPAWFNNTLYYGTYGIPMKAFTFTNGSFVLASQTANPFFYPGTTPSISANGTSNGIVWAVSNDSPAVLHAFDALDLYRELYNSNQAAGGRDNFGAGNKFIVSTIANGKVYVGTTTGVGVFGLLNASSGAPTLAVANTHTGNFTAGQNGAAYAITVQNTGSASTSGTVTVIDTLAAAVNATSIAGSGWSCTQPAGPCTRNDALGAGSSYPIITLTVNIASSATGSLVNTVTASGGGAANTGIATDTAIVASGLAAPVLISPSNGVAGVSLAPTLTWNSASGAVSYDVYFGTLSSPPLATNTTSVSYSPGTLSANATYYWKVVARDGGGSASSAVLSFMTGPLTFIPITPCRIADTRNANGPFGGPALAAQASRDFVIPNSSCNIPANAAAYSLNIAVVPRGTLGYLTAYPAGQPAPLVATLNSIDGRIKSNAVIVPAGVNGAVSLFATDTTEVILDINGYFIAGADAGALAFYPLTPCRIADTRNSTSPLGGPSLAAQGTRSFPIPASSCGLPANAQAYSLNLAAVPKGPTLGFLTAWPAGQPQPMAASLNDPTGTVLSNAVVVPAGTGGDVNIFTTDNTDLVIDINGYFAPPGSGGLSLYTVTPCRVLDSRLPLGSPAFSAPRDVNVTANSCGVPAAAQAFVFNATVVPPGSLGFITMGPQGPTQPVAATLNATDGAITNNMAIVPAANGSITVFPSAPTHLVLDIFGYFAP
jgi:hypothetical protein